MKVKSLKIREILATNSKKTIEVELETATGKAKASVPFGTSKGKYEVKYFDVNQAIQKFNLIRRHFRNQEFSDQQDVDNFLHIIDKSPDFREIGGNVALAISSVFLKAFALENKQDVFEFLGGSTISKPLCNIVGGWKGQSDIQEFLIFSVHQKSFLDSITKISEAYLEVGNQLKSLDKTFNFGKNLESAWVTSLNYEKILEVLKKVADKNLLRIGLDVAASQLWDGRYYVYSNGQKVGRLEQVSLIEDLIKKYSISYTEDPFHEDDFISFSTLTKRIRPRMVCGDDLYATNLNRLELGIAHKATNAIIIKPSQIGTITDVKKVVEEAKKNGVTTIMSHRSGETDDTLISHLAVGLNCEFIKLGISGERVIKINEMLRIEDKLRG